jgi:hypothetical protein
MWGPAIEQLLAVGVGAAADDLGIALGLRLDFGQHAIGFAVDFRGPAAPF